MKHNIKHLVIAVLAAACTAVSCDSYFDINLKDQATLEDIMSRSTAVRQYLAHLYSYIPQDENLRGNEGGTNLRSDEALHAKSQWETNWYKVRRGEYSSASAVDVSSGNYWKKFYEAINECSTFMENLHFDKEDSEKLVACMEGEARFLRAYYYFCLFRHYGPVFLWMDENGDPVPSDQSITGDKIDRHTVEQNVNFIVKELDRAAQLLPDDISDVIASYSNMGRATKGAAMALKARLLLYAASPLYNGQNGIGIYSGLVNSRGEKLFPEYDINKWDVAAKAAKDVIDLNHYTLTQKGSPMTSIQDAADSYQNVWFENWSTNPEIIWGWWYRQWGEDYLGTIGAELAFSFPSGGKLCRNGFSLITPSLKLVDAYPMAESGRYPVIGYYETNSMPDYSRPMVDPLSGYKATGWDNNYQQIVDVSPTWAKPFKAHNSTVGRDARFYSNFVPNGFWWPCERPMDGDAQRFTCYDNKECTSPYSATEGCNRVGYTWRRLYKAGNQLKENTDYSSIRYVFPAFRIAEVYLSYAEALNEKKDRDANTAIMYVDMVRARSGLKGLREAYPEIDFEGAGGTIGEVTRSGQDWLRWMIRQEKMCEFAFEGSQRHYDAMRTMVALKEYNVENWTLHLTADNYEDSYTRVSDDYIGGRSVFLSRDYLFPFGSAQLAEMTNFTQNPGW
ncbi:MAG: RagB/SusD family nutrient uptake outer membrane protein [Bacteroidales bacterium]|nr:RagB/SusD family nutrient uptake outer membrane protein [Bacteroidales bacterium]